MNTRRFTAGRAPLLMLGALALMGATTLQVHAQGARSHYLPRTERGRLAEQIVLRWSVEGAKQLDTTPQGWASAMGSAFARAPIAQLRRAAGATTYDQLRDSFQAASLGTMATDDLVFRSITPCRIVNTRNIENGILVAGKTRTFWGQIKASTTLTFASQGGAASKCGIPDEAVAVALQVLAARPEGDGHLTVYPSGTMPTASSLNYQPLKNISNELPMGLVPGFAGALKEFQVFTNVRTHFVADVVGYYVPLEIPSPPVPRLECGNGGSVTLPIQGNVDTINAPGCAADEMRVSINCQLLAGEEALAFVAGQTDSSCKFKDNPEPTVAGHGTASSTCCKVITQ